MGHKHRRRVSLVEQESPPPPPTTTHRCSPRTTTRRYICPPLHFHSESIQEVAYLCGGWLARCGGVPGLPVVRQACGFAYFTDQEVYYLLFTRCRIPPPRPPLACYLFVLIVIYISQIYAYRKHTTEAYMFSIISQAGRQAGCLANRRRTHPSCTVLPFANSFLPPLTSLNVVFKGGTFQFVEIQP